MKWVFATILVIVGLLFTRFVYLHTTPEGIILHSRNHSKVVMPVYYVCYFPPMDDFAMKYILNVSVPEYLYEIVCDKICKKLNTTLPMNYHGEVRINEDIRDIMNGSLEKARMCICFPERYRKIRCRDIKNEIDISDIFYYEDRVK